MTFVKKATKVHGNKYEYSKSVYINSKTKVEIICKKHGSFMQLPTTHLSGANCPKCNKEDRRLKLTKTTEEFIKEANKIHNNVYDYTLVEYVNARTKVDIICKLHGKFSQAPNVHTSMKHGCPECGKIKMGKSHRLSNDDFLSKSKRVHKGEIVPLEVYNNARTKILFHCNICDNDFQQKSNNHLNGSGCPVCRESKGSKRIRDYLKSNNISFEMEKRFSDCRGSKLPLPFDYYLSDYNTLVEFDGIQHYEMTYFSGNLTKKECELRLSNYQKHDKIKDNYCIEKGIKLIRIPYWEVDNIDSILQLKLY